MVLDCKHLVVVSSYAYCHQALAQLSKPSHRQEDHLSCGAICDLFCGGSCLCKKCVDIDAGTSILPQVQTLLL